MTIANAWLGSMQVSSVSQSQLLSQAAFSMTSVVLSVVSCVDRVCVRISGSCTEAINISAVPVAGTAYSTVVFADSTSGRTSFFWQPDRPLFLAPGDYITAGVTNTGLTAAVYGSMLQMY